MPSGLMMWPPTIPQPRTRALPKPPQPQSPCPAQGLGPSPKALAPPATTSLVLDWARALACPPAPALRKIPGPTRRPPPGVPRRVPQTLTWHAAFLTTTTLQMEAGRRGMRPAMPRGACPALQASYSHPTPLLQPPVTARQGRAAAPASHPRWWTGAQSGGRVAARRAGYLSGPACLGQATGLRRGQWWLTPVWQWERVAARGPGSSSLLLTPSILQHLEPPFSQPPQLFQMWQLMSPTSRRLCWCPPLVLVSEWTRHRCRRQAGRHLSWPLLPRPRLCSPPLPHQAVHMRPAG